MDTIFALASARGKSGVAVVRVSGARAHDCVRHLAGDVPTPRVASLRALRDASGDLIDQALVLVFEAGHSFTGEMVAEFQVHGSPAVIARLSEVLTADLGLRLAEPGEFTRRALENDRLDLAEVEGLADLVNAESEMQRKLALRVFSGALGKKVEVWRARLIEAASLVEASIDFADEDVPVDVSADVRSILTNLREELMREIRGSAVAERIRDGFQVAILGAPNIGKSTLLNRLAGREAAITSEIAGTTRDVIEVRMDLHGLPVTFLDTAGLRETDDTVEALGVARARERGAQADLRVFLIGPDEDFPGAGPDDIVLRGKADLDESISGVSGLTGAGVNALVEDITRRLESRAALAETATRARHRAALETGVSSIDASLKEMDAGDARLELAAEDMRRAINGLEALVGRVDIESVLDEIFSRFCLGK